MTRLAASALAAACLACAGPLEFGSDEGDDTSDAGTPTPEGDAEAFLAAHNAVRDEVGVPPLAYDADVERSALAWATSLADDDCAFEHEDQGDYGENLWWSSYDPSPAEVVEGWASEEAFYDYDSNRCDRGKACGHYTQVVWADSEVLGCGKGTCDSGAVIWACRYDPPGNWVGERPY